MRILRFFLLTFFSLLTADQPSSPQELSTLGGDSSHFIWDCVNPITGDLIFHQEDMFIKGAQPLSIQRTYCSREIDNPSLAWDPFKHLKAKGAIHKSHLSFVVPEPNGLTLAYTYLPTTTVENKKVYRNIGIPFTIRPPSEQFQCGITDKIEDSYGFSYDPRQNRLTSDLETLQLQLSNGATRHYICTKSDRDHFFYLLQKEILPNGNAIHYQWVHSDKEPYLRSIYSTDCCGRTTYASLGLKAVQESHCMQIEMKGSDNTEGTYLFEKLRISAKGNKKGWFLKDANLSSFPDEHLTYTSRECLLKKRKYPEGRHLEISYDKKHRVTELEGPEGTFCSIKYHDNHTTAIDEHGNKIRYYYDPKTLRITSIEYLQGGKDLLRKETFSWSATGRLTEKQIGDDSITYKESYSYDERGNILEKTLISPETSYMYSYQYDEQNRCITVSEDNGSKITTSYLNKTHLPTKTSQYQDGTLIATTHYYYNDGGCLLCEVEEDPNTSERKITEYTLRSQAPFPGLPAKKEEFFEKNGDTSLLRKITYAYDDYGNIHIETTFDAEGQERFSTQKHYNSKGYLEKEVDAEGNATCFSYDSNGNLIEEISPKGFVTTYSYDACNRLIAKTKNNDTTSFQNFGPDNKPRIIISPTNGITENHYDLFGNLLSTKDPQGAIWNYRYDVLHYTISETDPLGHTTQTKRNIDGEPLYIEHPDGTCELFCYHSDGKLDTYTNQENTNTTYEYDIYGNVTKEILTDAWTNPLGEKTATYSLFHLLEEIDLEGNKTTYCYNSLGQLAQKTFAERATFYTYDHLGRPATETVSDWSTEWTYDNLDRILSERQTSNGFLCTKSETRYDPEGNICEEITYPNNEPARASFSYDALNRLICSKDPLGHITKTSYEKRNNQLIATTQEPGGLTNLETYNNHEQLIQQERRNASGETISLIEFAYDLNGNPTQEKTHVFENTTKIRTHTIDRTYDSMQRLASETEAGSKITRYSYTPTGLLQTLTKPDGTTLTTHYDVLGYKTHLKGPGISYVYKHNHLGHLTGIYDTTHDLRTMRIVDPDGNILEETLGNGHKISSRYDTAGRKILTSLPNDEIILYEYQGPHLIHVKAKDCIHEYTYDLAGNVIEQTHIDGSTSTTEYTPLSQPSSFQSPHFSQTCQYDARGNLFSSKYGSEEKNYLYDVHDQILSEPSHKYTYDSLHNRLSHNELAFSLNHLNQYDGLIYDLNGNPTSIGTMDIEYDALDRPIRITTPIQTTTYTYDSEHRRLYKNQTPYIWDGNHELGTLETYRILGHTPLAEIGATIAIIHNRETLFPLHDLQGNLIRIGKNQQSFSAFGEGIHLASWGFCSKRFDPESELIYFGKRYYSPRLGRFLTPDPEGYTDSQNLYAFCNNNPLIHQDAHGLSIHLYRDDFQQTSRGAIQGIVDWTLDTTLTTFQYLGGFHAPEEFSLAQTIDMHRQANKDIYTNTQQWVQNTIGGDPTNRAYQFGYRGSQFSAELAATALIPTGPIFRGSKIAFNASKSIPAMRTAMKTKSVQKMIFGTKQAKNLSNRLVKASQNQTKNRITRLRPHTDARGIHTSFKFDRTGKISGYETYEWNVAAKKWDPYLRFRSQGKQHGGVSPPFVLERRASKGVGSLPKKPRKPYAYEIPKGH